jgi:hypothetical protein
LIGNGNGISRQTREPGPKVDTAAIEAEDLGLAMAILILRTARLEIGRTEPDEVESMPRNNLVGKLN